MSSDTCISSYNNEYPLMKSMVEPHIIKCMFFVIPSYIIHYRHIAYYLNESNKMKKGGRGSFKYRLTAIDHCINYCNWDVYRENCSLHLVH